MALHRLSAHIACVGALLLHADHVGAQVAEPRTVRVTLESTEPGVAIGLFPRGANVKRAKAIMRCVGRCTAQVKPGRYTFAVAGNHGFVGGSRDVEFHTHVRLLIDPDTVEHRAVGLVLGIGGAVLLGFGLMSGMGERREEDVAAARRDLVFKLAGLGISSVGWVLYATSLKPEWEAIYAREAWLKPRFNLGFVPKKDGGLLGATLSF